MATTRVIPSVFTLRNHWTLGGVKSFNAKGMNIELMKSEVGSLSQYMATQEFGGVDRATQGAALAIPTPAATDETVRPTRKLPTRGRKFKNINLKGDQTRKRNKFFYRKTSKGAGVFLSQNKGARVRMIYDLSHPAVTIPKRPWLKPSTETVKRKLPRIFVSQMGRAVRKIIKK